MVSVDITLKFLLLNQLRFLKSQGYDIHAVCSPGKWVQDIENEGVGVKTIYIKRRFFTPVSDLFALARLFLYFKQQKFDIVHTHTPKASFLGQLSAKMAGVPIIINTIHGLYFTKKSGFLRRTVFILLEKIAAKCSDVIFFVNHEDMVTAVKENICPPERERYFGGGVNIERFNPGRFSQKYILETKKQMGISQDSSVVGIVARLVKEKGYPELFSAFKKVLVRFPKAVLLIAGQEEKEKSDAISPEIFKKYGIEKSTIFLGERTDIEKFYSLMDVFVLPSHREGLGISIIEASCMGKPVIATNIRGCREVVEDGATGKMVSVGDVDKLAEAIIYMLSNKPYAEAMGLKGRLKVLKEFDERMVFDRIKKEYERLIKEKL